MGGDKHGNELIESFRSCVRFFECGDLTTKEVINKVLISLGASERFDLVDETVALLPLPVRDELRKTVAEILRDGSSYRGLFILGRASEDWWKKTREGVGRLAVMLKPLLEVKSEQGNKCQ